MREKWPKMMSKLRSYLGPRGQRGGRPHGRPAGERGVERQRVEVLPRDVGVLVDRLREQPVQHKAWECLKPRIGHNIGLQTAISS